jgi:hypothetical protein
MDHFFSIPELVELMCEGLGHPRVHRKDLAALARTATVFRRPALDLLWQHQDSANLINIILCILPADLWESEDLVKASINLYGVLLVHQWMIRAQCHSGLQVAPLPLRISIAR